MRRAAEEERVAPPRVLIIDDDEGHAEALADGLEQAVAYVIGHDGDPSRPGALGRMLGEVDALLNDAEDC